MHSEGELLKEMLSFFQQICEVSTRKELNLLLTLSAFSGAFQRGRLSALSVLPAFIPAFSGF